MDGFSRTKHRNGLARAFKYVEDGRVLPVSRVQFHTALRACLELNKTKVFWSLLDQMKKENIKFDAPTYTHLLFLLMRASTPDHVLRVLETTESKSIRFDSKTLFPALVHYFIKKLYSPGIDKLYNCYLNGLISLDDDSRRALIAHFRSRNDMERHARLMEMTGHHEIPSASRETFEL